MIHVALAQVPFFWSLISVLWVLIAILMILVILLQKGRGGGIGGAFGGAGAPGGGLLGTKTGDFLTWVTISMVALFLVLGIALVKFYRPSAPTADTPATMPAPGSEGERPGETPIVSPPVERTPSEATQEEAALEAEGEPVEKDIDAQSDVVPQPDQQQQEGAGDNTDGKEAPVQD